jgi:hypothetical protein
VLPLIPIRSKIRARATELLAGLAAFEGHVFNARNPPLRRDLLPAARVYVDRDNRVNQSQSQDIGFYLGEMTLTVQVIVEAGSDPTTADRLDQFCALAEYALLTDQVWRKLVPRVDGLETDITLDSQGELRTAIGTINIACRYADCMVPVFADDLKTMRIQLDFIDPPADPNLVGHPTDPPDGYPGGYPGPDGRIEIEAEFNLSPTDWDDGATDWEDGDTDWDSGAPPGGSD